jgi:hypothetical protein
MAQLKVVSEDQPVLGRDYFDAMPRVQLMNTPCAIARVAQSTSYRHHMTLSAESSKDVNGLPLKYHWVVLRGDPKRISITKKNDSGSVVTLAVAHHERRPVTEGSAMASNRVDIGLFVHNGTYHSAPAIVSFYFPDNQKRVYRPDRTILSVDYTLKNYADPFLAIAKDWRDEYHYDDAGKLLGWTRIRGDRRESFAPDGRLVLQTDPQGRPTATAAVRYTVRRDPKGVPYLVQSRAMAKP